jgi:hypothetical protein
MTLAPEMMVPLSETNIAGLMKLRHEGESINDAIARLLKSSAPRKNKPPKQAGTLPQGKKTHKYTCYVFDEPAFGGSLREVFGNVLDVMHDLDPTVLERLANKRLSKRRSIISKDESDVHFERADLKVAKSKSGWWYSINVSQDQVKRMLEELCKVEGLEFGVDIRWGNLTATDYPCSPAG